MQLEEWRTTAAQRLRVVGFAAFLMFVGMRLAADTFGSLLIESDPAGATVYVDGRVAGQTPLKLTSAPTGVHRVRLELVGYLENSQLVTVTDGKETRLKTKLTAVPLQLKIVVLEGRRRRQHHSAKDRCRTGRRSARSERRARRGCRRTVCDSKGRCVVSRRADLDDYDRRARPRNTGGIHSDRARST